MFNLTLSTGNDVFVNPNGEFDTVYGGYELASILQRVANQLRNGNLKGVCRDTNGNMVGEWKIIEE